jgi:hypothetical protein
MARKVILGPIDVAIEIIFNDDGSITVLHGTGNQDPDRLVREGASREEDPTAYEVADLFLKVARRLEKRAEP